MSEHINLRGVVSKPWIGSSGVFRWLGYALIALGLLGSLGGLLPMVNDPLIKLDAHQLGISCSYRCSAPGTRKCPGADQRDF